MSYIGQSPGQGQAERFIFTATGGETSVTLDDAGRGIAYTVGQVDVYLNGVKLVNGTDFTATSGSSITGLSALVASDIVEIVALDAFSPADTVSASNGGTFSGNVTHSGTLTSTGTTALQNLSTTNSALNISSSASDGSATIDASGNLLVGKTSAGFGTAGTEIQADGDVLLTRNSARPLLLNRLTNDGSLIEFYKDSTTVGSISVWSDELTLGSGPTGLKINDGLDAIHPINAGSGAARDATVVLGTSTNRFKDLYLSGGIYLGGTGAANYLDDYEEGTWTPSMTGIGTGTVSESYGKYIKIGNLVYVAGKIGVTNTTGTSLLSMTGFPFSCADSGDSSTRPSLVPEGDWDGLNSSYDRVTFRMSGSSAQGINGTSYSTYMSANELSSSFDFNFHVTYITS